VACKPQSQADAVTQIICKATNGGVASSSGRSQTLAQLNAALTLDKTPVLRRDKPIVEDAGRLTYALQLQVLEDKSTVSFPKPTAGSDLDVQVQFAKVRTHCR
jgi:hypothetical protein